MKLEAIIEPKQVEEIATSFGAGRMTVRRVVKKHDLASDEPGVQWET